MAIDSRIALNSKPINIGERFAQNTQNLRNVDILNQQRDLAPIQLEQAQRANELGAAQQPALLQLAEFAAGGGTQALLNAEQVAKLDQFNAQALNTALASGNPQVVTDALNVQLQNAIKFKLNDDIAEAQQALQMVNQEGGLQALQQATTAALTPINSRSKSVSQREFDANVAAVKADPELKTIDGQAASVALGLTAKASLTKDERIARDKALGQLVAEQKGLEAGAVEGAKLTKQLKFKPKITRAVKLAEKEAIERGEVLTDLSRMEATLPTLLEVTGELRELATIATSTFGGKLFDQAVKQTGFGATKGSTARAKFIAIIDNQVLPLLKPTFGAAFTVPEGDNLRKTLGDPDATIDAKLAQIDAFISQKERDIRAKQTQLNLPSAGNEDVPEIIDSSASSDEDLKARLGIL